MRPVVVIPTYNERDNIEKLVREVLLQGEEVHLLVVDDNSPDGTGEIADRPCGVQVFTDVGGQTDDPTRRRRQPHRLAAGVIDHDAGLRRCYLGNVPVNRDIVAAWLRESSRRGGRNLPSVGINARTNPFGSGGCPARGYRG